MAALTFLACNAIHGLFDWTRVFVRSGCSFSRSYRYLLARRRQLLFREYCRAEWRRYLAYPLDAIDERRVGAEIREVRQQKQVSSSTVYVSDSTNQQQIQQEKQKQPKSQHHLKDTDTVDFGDTSRMHPSIDFAAVEASAEAYENQLRHEQAERAALGNFDDIEVIDGQEIDSTFYDYVDTLPVYQNDNLGRMQEGLSFTITGYILPNCERFSINFILDNENRDVALHINPRLPQNYIVRNTRVRQVWGGEEVSSALPFALRRGSKFAIQVLLTDACYMISVNGHHFAEYNHRLPYKAVTCVEVKGDVDNVTMERSIVTNYPDRLPESRAKEIRTTVGGGALTPTGNDDSGMDEAFDDVDGTSGCIPREFKLIPRRRDGAETTSLSPSRADDGLALPYYGRLPPLGLTKGRSLRVEGRVKLLPHSFYINLQQGQDIWPHAIIAFHFNPRFSKQSGALGKHIVCRNAWFNGAWAEEERSELDTDFRPGKTFSLVIACAAEAYEVYVNRKLITEFRYRVTPAVVDTVYVQGDIKLWSVVLEDGNTSFNGQKRIYNNPGYTEDC